MTVYIIDIIGSHSGMHFYNKSFKDVLINSYEKVVLVSNYNDSENEGVALFENYYQGYFFVKIFRLIKTLSKFYFFILRNRKNYFIFLSYGNIYEFIFLWPLVCCKKLVIDIHEVISLITKKPIQYKLRKLYSKVLYNHLVDTVIVHSERSELLLDAIGYRKLRLHVPHFSYCIDKTISGESISYEVESLINHDKINILVFGFIRNSKGIDMVVDVAGKIADNQYGDRFNFIIAGNDPDNIVKPLIHKQQNKFSGTLTSLLRYINDNELKFLFSNVNYVFLPYKEISQSGLLEMAIHFRKPVITSSLLYFRDFLGRFPSFGIFCDCVHVEDFLNVFKAIADENPDCKPSFYSDADLKSYNEYKNTEEFIVKLKKVFPVSDN